MSFLAPKIQFSQNNWSVGRDSLIQADFTDPSGLDSDQRPTTKNIKLVLHNFCATNDDFSPDDPVTGGLDRIGQAKQQTTVLIFFFTILHHVNYTLQSSAK